MRKFLSILTLLPLFITVGCCDDESIMPSLKPMLNNADDFFNYYTAEEVRPLVKDGNKWKLKDFSDSNIDGLSSIQIYTYGFLFINGKIYVEILPDDASLYLAWQYYSYNKNKLANSGYAGIDAKEKTDCYEHLMVDSHLTLDEASGCLSTPTNILAGESRGTRYLLLEASTYQFRVRVECKEPFRERDGFEITYITNHQLKHYSLHETQEDALNYVKQTLNAEE